jgi:hypothetical protein
MILTKSLFQKATSQENKLERGGKSDWIAAARSPDLQDQGLPAAPAFSIITWLLARRITVFIPGQLHRGLTNRPAESMFVG